MLMCVAVLGGLCVAAGLLLVVVKLTGPVSNAATTAMWFLLGIGAILLIGSRWLFGRFLRRYLTEPEGRDPGEVTHR